MGTSYGVAIPEMIFSVMGVAQAAAFWSPPPPRQRRQR